MAPKSLLVGTLIWLAIPADGAGRRVHGHRDEP